MPDFITYATFKTTDAHREYFKKGNIVENWSRMYPFLFDAHDTQIALNQRHLGYHYYFVVEICLVTLEMIKDKAYRISNDL